ncbi:hypothetical protein [Acinetobacter pittii]|uniref:hypothetical protein n=1 Tax=Acinetobacter pittii TaxID=48296 RepID=UPI001F4259B2|nr:hypothetical protein [Acinetobacter pittii]MCE6238359.1 hypothetical protein [Acinetobacter pittii]MCE6689622.1 hypothetical protein [Acinetobacter pittii]MCE6697886.1 hypothetical protein [Acinetobacter pittii]
MIESMTPSMYIKQDFSAEIAAWVEQGNQITVLGRGESTHNKAFNNREKRTPQDAMRRVMANSVAQTRNAKDPYFQVRMEAKQKGLIHFDGRVCPKCSMRVRYVSTTKCVTCTRSNNSKRDRRVAA